MNETQWHEWRRQGIGGSDIGVLLGYSQYCTPLELYRLKVGETQPEPPDDLAQLGQDNERAILDRIEKKHKVKLQRDLKIVGSGSEDDMWMQGTLDGWCSEDRAIFDAKYSKSDGWGEPGTDNVPMRIFLQMHWYIMIKNAKTAYVFKRCPFSGKVTIYVVNPDEKLEVYIKKVAYHFWHNHVLKKVPPKNAIYGTTEINKKIINLRTINEQLKPLNKSKEELKTEIKEFMGDREFLISPDSKEITKYTKCTKENFDKEQFKLDYPDLYQQYVTETEQRRFYA